MKGLWVLLNKKVTRTILHSPLDMWSWTSECHCVFLFDCCFLLTKYKWTFLTPLNYSMCLLCTCIWVAVTFDLETYLLTYLQRSSISVCLWPSFLLFPRSDSSTLAPLLLYVSMCSLVYHTYTFLLVFNAVLFWWWNFDLF